MQAISGDGRIWQAFVEVCSTGRIALVCGILRPCACLRDVGGHSGHVLGAIEHWVTGERWTRHPYDSICVPAKAAGRSNPRAQDWLLEFAGIRNERNARKRAGSWPQGDAR